MNQMRTLGDYTLIKQIGNGALGVVYLAEHRFMKKHFALKILPEDLCSDRAFIQRFEEDVSKLSVLDHPHIVKIHNVSYSEGQYFLVTDCVVDGDGETTNLAQYLQARGNKLPEEEIYRLLYQLATALDYAHHFKGPGNGMAHRGIKLNNILVSQNEEGTQLLLSDYGLSRIIGAGNFLTRSYKVMAESLGLAQAIEKGAIDTDKAIPLHNSFMQSYQFLAPEQKRLDSKIPIDMMADTYSFGILVYYMLMGHYPEGYFEMPKGHLPPFAFSWDHLIQTCLQVDPSNRPDQLIQALSAVKEQPSEVSHPHAEAILVQTAIVSEESLKPVLQMAQLERPEVDHDPAAVFQIDTSVKQYTPELKEDKPVQPILTDMVVVMGGPFSRGSVDGNRDEMPRHQVMLDSFAMDIHPVTNEQFVRFLEAMGGTKDSNHQDIIRLKDSRIKNSKGKFSIESGYIKHPVVGVTWYGAVAFARWVGKRLPTEAEWEIAARGGLENALYPTGDDIEKPQANFFSADTTVVMSYPTNEYGIYDMAGNVYEWCQDWYGYNYYETSVQEPSNPKGPHQGVYRVLRGGCWKSLKEDLRCSRRHRNNPGTVNSTYGFRCAADVE